MRIVTLVLLGAVGAGVGGCDTWPTSFVNSGPMPVSYSDQDRFEDVPTPMFRLDAGESTLLRMGRRLRDFREIRIIEDGRQFVISHAELTQLAQDCPGYECTLIYSGEGRLSARPRTSEDMKAAVRR